MSQEELNKLCEMYDRMYSVCLHTLTTVESISEHHKTSIGKLNYIKYANFKIEINNLKVYLQNYMDRLRPIEIIKLKE